MKVASEKLPAFTTAVFTFGEWVLVFEPSDEQIRGRKAFVVDITRSGRLVNSWVVRPTTATRTGALELIRQELEDARIAEQVLP